MGSIALADVGMIFLGGDPTGGDAPACKFPCVMACFPRFSWWETVGCSGSAGAGVASFPPYSIPAPSCPKLGQV